MAWFHAHDGWYFDRLPDGSVEISRRAPVQEMAWVDSKPVLRGHKVDPTTEVQASTFPHVTLQRVVFTPETWGSIVSSLSKDGETNQTYEAAVRLHNGAEEGNE